MKIEFLLNGLNCAHCASVIEEKIDSLDTVDKANLNFINKKFVVDFTTEENIEDKIEEVRKIIDTTEPGLEILILNKAKSKSHSHHDHHDHSHEHSHDHEHGEEDSRKHILIIGISIALYILGFLSKRYMSNEYISIAIFLIAYVIVGKEVLMSALNNLFRGKMLDENFLMTIATVGAIAIGEYPEAVGVMVFYSIGEYLEHRAVARSRKNIEDLMNIKPEIANLLVDGSIVEVNPEDVKIGDLIIVKVGEKVPLDGIVVKGESLFDTSAITGESVLKEISTGDKILSGVINKNSVVTVKVEKTMSESTVSKIFEMVENATAKKSPTENFITVFAKYYTPIVVGLALLLAVAPPILTGDEFSKWLYRGLIFLVVSCPCALVLSIPLTYFSGIGISSKNGILVKGSNYLEALKNVDTVVLDKTGTITKGNFKVTKVNSVDENDIEKILKYAYISESRSTHPIATSITRYCEEKYDFKNLIEENKISSYEELSAKGIRIVFDGEEILSGNYRLMEDFKVEYSERENSSTKVHLAVDRVYLGSIEIADELKEGVVEAIQELYKIGVNKVVMLTGDSEKVAREVAQTAGIKEYHANLLPNNKVEILESIIEGKETGKKVAFIGDGINDAPVIARADVGISMGGMGSDAAIEASDVVFMTDEIGKMPLGINIARFTGKIVMQNIVFAIGVKVLVMILSTVGIANMWLAIFADVGVAVIAVLNSLRVLKYR